MNTNVFLKLLHLRLYMQGHPGAHSLAGSLVCQGALQRKHDVTIPLTVQTVLGNKKKHIRNTHIQGQNLNTNFFPKLFGHARDTRAEIPGYPAQKLGCPGFLRTYRTFWPLPVHVEDPTPPEDVLTRKFGFVLFFLA